MPMAKVEVFSVPDGDWAMTLRPFISGLMVLCWMPEGDLIPVADCMRIQKLG